MTFLVMQQKGSLRVRVADVTDTHDLYCAAHGTLESFSVNEPEASARSIIPVWSWSLLTSDCLATRTAWIAGYVFAAFEAEPHDYLRMGAVKHDGITRW